MIEGLINTLWLWSQRKNYDKFVANLGNSSEIQYKILDTYLKKNVNTVYGKKYNFNTIKSYNDFKKNVPIIEDYNQISEEINRIEKGELDILFNGKPLLFEETSGSTQASKLIPYTKELREEFQRSISVWMWDMKIQYPEIFKGKSYWSISPQLKRKYYTSGNIQVGIEDDSEYLNPIVAVLFNHTLAVKGLQNVSDRNEFYKKTWKQLLYNRNKVRFISVWSPSFLLQLIDQYKGIYNIKEEIHVKSIFPNLVAISCWKDAQASFWIPELNKLCNGVNVLEKGLLSTEGVVTIPFSKRKVLAYQSHFYEFKDSTGMIYDLSGVKRNEEYEVIFTTGGGLYRYNTKDKVYCYDFIEKTPCFHFIGRSHLNSDMVGEKVSETFLQQIKQALLSEFDFYQLFIEPIKSNRSAKYKIHIFSDSLDLIAFKERVNFLLCQNIYYEQALKIGQLHKEEIIVYNKKDIYDFIKSYNANHGIKDGNVKLSILLKGNDVND